MHRGSILNFLHCKLSYVGKIFEQAFHTKFWTFGDTLSDQFFFFFMCYHSSVQVSAYLYSGDSRKFFKMVTKKFKLYKKSNKMIIWIFATIASQVAKKNKIVATIKPKRL